MNKEIKEVPRGISFLSEWEGFNLPFHPCILNKQITGCGFTQWALTCEQNIVLCSPRRVLLENKEAQFFKQIKKGFSFPYDLYYARNEYERVLDVGKDLNNIDKSVEEEKVTPVDYNKDYRKKVEEFILRCMMNNKYCKILVTYDSFRKIKEVLQRLNLFDKFHVVIDEFQSIFTDSRFKASTELEFVGTLNGIQRLAYVSATPMIEDYLDEMDEFKNLPYYELDWGAQDPSRITKPKINPTPCARFITKVAEIVERYRTGVWRDSDNAVIRYRDDQGQIQEFQSREAVFYINSVKNICDIIKKCKLTQDECNIIVAKTAANEEAIRKAFKIKKKDEWKGIGRIPLSGEQNKMFTFCTRTAYLGADFYSNNARSFVFSDSNIDCLAVDITLDLPQILGRQRDEGNPWKNELNIYFRPTVDIKKVTKDQFMKVLEDKVRGTNDRLKAFGEILSGSGKDLVLDDYERRARDYKYREDYVSVNRHDGKTPIPQFNKLVMLSEKRSFEIQQLDYADRCSVRSSINTQMGLDDSEEIKEFLKEYEESNVFLDKMKLTCEFLEKISDNDVKEHILVRIDEQLSNYIRVLGIERIKAFSYIRIRLDREMNKLLNNQTIDPSDLIYKKFSVSNRYSNAYAKATLKKIYQDIGLQKTAKAVDLSEYFEIKPISYLENGKKINGLELLKKKKK